MLSFILFGLAAFFNAVMDTLDVGHFTNSVFKKWNPKFWAKGVSWQYAPHVFGYPIDAWHLSKSLMILCLASSAVLYHCLLPSPLLDLTLLGTIWIGIFDLFYVHLLVNKQ